MLTAAHTLENGDGSTLRLSKFQFAVNSLIRELTANLTAKITANFFAPRETSINTGDSEASGK